MVQTPTTNQPVAIQPAPVTPPGDETTNWKVYTNARYGFEIEYPQSLNFIDVKEEIVDQGNTFIRFNVKTTSEIWGIGDGKYHIFTIAIQPKELVVQESKARGENFDTKNALGENNGKYYLFSRSQDVPEDWQDVNLPFDKIKSSFKFTK